MPEPLDQESNLANLEGDLHQIGTILESVAARFPPDSEEVRAIRDAAAAHLVVRMHRAKKRSFETMKAAFDGQLTEEMKADLRRHGIVPGDFDDEEPDAAAP
jgi:hypothetical protein